jgi:hypothetical protein
VREIDRKSGGEGERVYTAQVSSITVPRHSRFGSAAAGRWGRHSRTRQSLRTRVRERSLRKRGRERDDDDVDGERERASLVSVASHLDGQAARRRSLAPPLETSESLPPSRDPATGHRMLSGGGGPGRLDPADKRLPSGDWGMGQMLAKQMSRSVTHTHDSTHTPLSLSVCIKRSDIDKTGSLSLSLSLSLKHTHTHTELRGREAGKIETGPSDPSLTDSDAGPRPDPGSRVWAKR